MLAICQNCPAARMRPAIESFLILFIISLPIFRGSHILIWCGCCLPVKPTQPNTNPNPYKFILYWSPSTTIGLLYCSTVTVTCADPNETFPQSSSALYSISEESLKCNVFLTDWHYCSLRSFIIKVSSKRDVFRAFCQWIGFYIRRQKWSSQSCNSELLDEELQATEHLQLLSSLFGHISDSVLLPQKLRDLMNTCYYHR